MAKTDFREFPQTTHDLLEQVLGSEDRRLYSVTSHYSKGRLVVYEDGRIFSVGVKEEQVRRYPYEILSVSSVPAGGYAGSCLKLVFRNKETGELGEKILFTWNNLVRGLEKKLKKEGRLDQIFSNSDDRESYNRHLQQFQGLEIDGVTVELSTEDSKKYEILLGIFLDKKG